MSVPVLCHVFLILFGGFFAIQMTFNSQKFAATLRMNSPEAAAAGESMRSVAANFFELKVS